MYEIAKIVGETRWYLGLSEVYGASADSYDLIDEWLGATELPSRIRHGIPPQNYQMLHESVPLTI